MKKSFSLIELVIVIVIIGILYSSVNFSLNNTTLNQAADQIISHINYTRHLAIKDNKMQYYPTSSNIIELNRSKYWFKQWWQIRFTQNTSNPKDWWYEVFTDLPYDNKTSNFDRLGKNPTNGYEATFAKNPLNKKYLTGKCGSGFPDCEDIDNRLNLTKTYSIVKIIFTNFKNEQRLLFDSYGNVYLREGDYDKNNGGGDQGDINPYDKDKRVPLLKKAIITLCNDDKCEKNISICISPKIGNAYLCK